MRQRHLFPPERPEWVRIPGVLNSKCGAEWVHVSGWRVIHCGHPTGLWPYYALPPGVSPQQARRSHMLLTGGMGRGTGFQTVAGAKVAALEQIALQERAPSRAVG